LSTPATTIQIPANLYARLQSLARRTHSSPAAMLEQLIEAGDQAAMITTVPGLRGGRPIIAGTGVTVRTVVGYYKLGLSPEETADEMGLELALVYAALAYYHRHIDEIETDIRDNLEQTVMQELGV
jgi:uncharacterized protein (DUF433 family)